MAKSNKTSKRVSKTVSVTAVVQPTISFDTTIVSAIRNGIVSLLARKNGQWNGTMTQLNRALSVGLSRTVRSNWPGSASILRRAVNSVVPALRREGVKTEFARTTDHARTRVVSFRSSR